MYVDFFRIQLSSRKNKLYIFPSDTQKLKFKKKRQALSNNQELEANYSNTDTINSRFQDTLITQWQKKGH